MSWVSVVRTLVGAHTGIGDWFDSFPSRAIIRELRSATVIVATPQDVLGWIKDLKSPSGDLDPRMGSFLNSLTVSTKANAGAIEADFVIPGGAANLQELIDCEEFELLLENRTATPFLDGETPSSAFERVFGSFLPAAEDWQIIDHYLLEQIANDDPVVDLLFSSIHAMPEKVEIHSKSTGPQKTQGEIQRLRSLRSAFEDQGKELQVYEYWSRPRPNNRKFPHPRIQKARFSRGEVFTTLDNGLRSLTGSGPIDLGPSTKETWADAFAQLKVMNCKSVLFGR